jgi:NADPH:quinone reductase-like Zn-dependent oxidoreductase/acyl carrier protein
VLLSSVAQLYGQGVSVDWQAFDHDSARRRVALPSYPFHKQRFWMQPSANGSSNSASVVRKRANQTNHVWHPLLGRALRLAQSEVVWFESDISQNNPSYLADHRIYQQVIVPATAYIEIALAAGATVIKSDRLTLENVSIQQPLLLTHGQSQTVQCTLTPGEMSHGYSFQIFSTANPEDTEPVWTLHASGTIAAGNDSPELLSSLSLESLPTQYEQTVSIADYYQSLQARGMEYGANFQAIRQIWRRAEGALGQIQLPAALRSDLAPYSLHPVLLDACFQVLGAALADTTQTDAYLPITVERLDVYRRSGAELWSQVQIHTANGSQQQGIKADLDLLDQDGNRVGQIKGLSLKRVSRQTLERLLQTTAHSYSDWLYRLVWQPKPIESATAQTRSGNWLLVTDSESTGFQLAAQLEQAGNRCVVAISDSQYQQHGDDRYRFNPLEPADLKQLLNDAFDASSPCQGVIGLWEGEPIAAAPDTLLTLQQSYTNSCASLLHLVQALAAVPWSPPPAVWVVTRATQAVGPSTHSLQLATTPLWGMTRTIALEHPHLQCRCLDLDPTAADFSDLLLELHSATTEPHEPQVAYRQGIRHVARLVRYRPEPAASLTNSAYRLCLSEYGMLEHLRLAPLERRSPKAGEVEIEVRAVGLNFRDVLNALGLLKRYSEEMGISDPQALPFGGECAGVVVAVGAGVTQVQLGDAVIAAQTIGSLASHVLVPAAFVVRKPESLSFEQAATLPTAFLTAYYALHHQAQLQAGERVLIHAAAGGVGQAAVQVAQWLGADVFATASPAKWPHLEQMGVTQLMHSRTLEFGEQVQQATQGQGVEVVLNSLNGEYIPTSLAALGTGGRFVEIGKLGIWSREQMQQTRPDVSYWPFDLLEVSLSEPEVVGQMLGELMGLVEQQVLQPLPQQVFELSEVVEAFRYMAQAKHIGKVVIRLPGVAEAESGASIGGDGSYLVTGGFGALGLQVAEWLVQQGARHLVLTGRRGPTEAQQAQLAALEQAGAVVQVVAADVAQPEAISLIQQAIATASVPLRGIVHAAGVLADGMVTTQSWSQYEQVLSPKVAGAWNLHCLTQGWPLDFFVCFSSVSAILGSPGQSNYAAANAFLDALAQHRQGLGLSGLSLNWGPWSAAGMAAALQDRNRARWAAQGVKLIEPAAGLRVFEALLSSSVPQLLVVPVEWSKFMAHLPAQWPLLEAFSQAQPAAANQPSRFLHQLKVTPRAKRKGLLVSHVREQITKVLGSPEPVGLQQALGDLGMDSLMAVELRNRLQTSLGCTIPATLAFDYPTVAALVDYLTEVLELEASPPESPPVPDNQQSERSDSLDQLSQDELANLLAQELSAIQEGKV